MDRDSSDSSSWSLVDVDDSGDGTDASDIDSVGDELIVESVHDSDSESEYSDEDEAERLSEAEEATEESDIDEPIEAAEEHFEAEVEAEESEDDESDEELEEGEIQNNNEESLIEEDPETIEEEEALAEAAALHFVEPAKVAAKFEELSKTMDTPFDRFFESISSPESGTRSLVFATVMLITVLGAGFGQYIGSSLLGDQRGVVPSLFNGPFCYESDRVTASIPPPFMQHSGLQYRESAIGDEPSTSESSPLEQCKESLYDAQSEVKMKSGVNRFVRENYKRQLQQAKQEFEARLESYKRASRRLLATKYSSQQSKKASPKHDSKEEEQQEDLFCKSFERPFLNFTRSIFSSVSNWTNNSVVKNIINLSPTFDRSLQKVSSWLRKSNNFSNNVYQRFHSLTKVPKLPKALNEVPKKAWDFLQSDFRSYAKKVTTALSKTNIQTTLMEYKKLPFVQKFQKRVQSALSRLSQLKTHAEEVCFASKKSCEASEKFAKNLENVPEFTSLIGKRQSKEYLQYLRSLSSKNCSHQMECERDWFMGCGPQFLENCQLKKWQAKRSFSGAALINRNLQMKEAAVGMGWILPKDRRNSIRCCHLSNSPLPCPSSNTLPTLPREELAPCQNGPNSAKPCQTTTTTTTPATPPRPCPASNQPCKPVQKPFNGRADWFTLRYQTRAAQRQAHSTKLSSSSSSSSKSSAKSLHFKNRRKQHA